MGIPKQVPQADIRKIVSDLASGLESLQYDDRLDSENLSEVLARIDT